MHDIYIFIRIVTVCCNFTENYSKSHIHKSYVFTHTLELDRKPRIQAQDNN